MARADLAHAFALDTITAVVACMPPAHLVVVTSDELTTTFVGSQGAIVVADPGDGLNPAIRQGIGYVERVLGPGPTAVLLGDIPTLRPKDLIDALSACAVHPRGPGPGRVRHGHGAAQRAVPTRPPSEVWCGLRA